MQGKGWLFHKYLSTGWLPKPIFHVGRAFRPDVRAKARTHMKKANKSERLAKDDSPRLRKKLHMEFMKCLHDNDHNLGRQEGRLAL
jgi:hypothetical protein